MPCSYLKFAVAVRLEFGIVMVIGLVVPVIVPVASPDQLVKLRNGFGLAVIVTCVPA